MQEEDYVEQEQSFQQVNIEDHTGSDDGIQPPPNTSSFPNDPPPMTNDLGEPVIITTTTIRVGEDYFRPQSEVEVDDLVSDQRINFQQKRIFQLQYEANYGALPKETVKEKPSNDVVETEKEEQIIPNSILPQETESETDKEEQIIPNSILPQETENETIVEDKTINLKELGGDDYVQNTTQNTEDNSIKSMPVPTPISTPIEEAPSIDLAQLSTQDTIEESDTPVENTKAPVPAPETDPDFQQVTEKVTEQSKKEQKHESSHRAVQKAENASEEPINKKRSLAEVKQVDRIESKDTPSFDTSSFVDMLMAKIIAITPKNEEEADKFKDENKVHEVKNMTSGQVEQKKTSSVGPLETATKETPNESGIPSKTVTPLPPAPIGPQPKDLGIEQGMPKKKETAQVEQPIQQNSQELEQQFQENEITDEQLAKSNEPTFLNALDTKNTAKEDSQNAPQQFRTEENQTLLETQSGAKQQGKDDLLAMHQDRAQILSNVQGEQENASSSYTAEEATVATKINGIYQSTKTEVEGILSRLDSRVSQLFDQGAAQARERFESYIAKKMAAYKEERYDGAIVGSATWIYDAFAGLPDEVNVFFVEGRHLYIEVMQRTIQSIADLVAQELTAAKQRVQAGRQEVADYVESLPDNLKKVGRSTAAAINRDFDELNSKVDAKQEELISSLAQKYVDNVTEIDGRIEEMKAANRGLIDIALDSVAGVIGTIIEIKNALTNVLSAALEAIGAIIMDPIGFLGNLIEGVGNGISNFMTKIDEYLTTGFVEWLTGAMSGAGIEMPENIFSLEGIFSITTQALGMTWDFIRDRAVDILGERAVGTIEESFEVFQVLRTEGIGGAWEYLKEQFGDLQETIMGSITSMLVSEVVEAGVKYLLALLTPAGAFVKAAMMIVDIAQFFMRQGSQILELVDAFVQSVSAIAAGSVGKVAEMIERALSLSVPVLIGLFTSLLGLGDLAAKVRKIFTKIKDRVTGAIDGFIEKAGAWFKDKKGRRKERKDKKRKEKEDKKKQEGSNSDKDKEEDKDSKKDKDERTDKQLQQDLNKGMKLGAAVVNNEQLNEDQIKVELNKLELKYRLDDLGARLTQETAEWHIFMLNARLDGKRKSQEIKRKPTKAENEEQVSEEDRKLHERIAAEVKAQLEAKGKSTEGVETFEEFYALLQSEAVMLQKKYQPQLRNGIKIAVDLVNSVQQDKKDGDVDIDVKIAPNTLYAKISAVFRKLFSGKGKYVLNRGDIQPASDEMGELLKDKKIGDTITYENNELIYIAEQAEYKLIQNNRLLKTAISTADGSHSLQALYLSSPNPLAFLIDVHKVLDLEDNNKAVTISDNFRKDGEKTVQLLLSEFGKIQKLKTGNKDGLSEDEYTRIKRALDRLPEFKSKIKTVQKIRPALALAYHPKSGKYELGINKSGDSGNGFSVDLHLEIQNKVDTLQEQLEQVISDYHGAMKPDVLNKYLDAFLGRQKIGSHAEVKAVSTLLKQLDLWIKEEQDEGRTVSYSTDEILVAVIRTSPGNGQEIGYEFVRCPNCTLVLNAININPITDNQDFLKNGVPQKQT